MKTEASIRKQYAYMSLPPFECGKGWNDLIADLCEEISKIDKKKAIRVQQIKEKYALIRYYINLPQKKFYKVISKYETISAKTCEVCGSEGKCKVLKDYPWYKTLCEKHAKKLGYVDVPKKASN